ncbi:MAG TPA: endonuclease/exonuclease/phosphatase family protein [Chloroflexota bacterium]|nr:endonuclease/exonuclease/phosphatase family protein [Chloroflexota bacterium]
MSDADDWPRWLLGGALLALLLGAGAVPPLAGAQALPTPTPSPAVTATAAASPTPTVTGTPQATGTATVTPTGTPATRTPATRTPATGTATSTPTLVATATVTGAPGVELVISQVYGGGGNSSAPLAHDFVELYNRGSTAVSLEGLSVQYASATGTGAFGANAGQLTPLSGTLAPGRYYLIQESGGTTGTPLPQPDLEDDTPINLSAAAGKVALVRGTASLGCNGESTPCAPDALARIVDLVGYGNANFFEGSGPAPALSNTTAAMRAGNGATDTNDNRGDFSAVAPAPRSSCFPDGCPATPSPTATPTGGPSATPMATPTVVQTPEPGRRIRDLQGLTHRSPLEGATVADVPGVVTARRSNGFYLQDPLPDGDPATSEGIFVFTSSAPAVSVGDDVRASGPVAEFRPGCDPSGCAPSESAFDNLTTSQIGATGRPATVTVVSSANPTPSPVVIGAGGRVPPATVIEDDAGGDVETSGRFDPATDGIDFYESLEGMLVRVDDVEVVGPRRSTGEIPVVVQGAGLRTARGGVVIQALDFNPERIFIDDAFLTTPQVDVGDRFPGPTIGVIDYTFANYKLQALSLPEPLSGGLSRESTAAPAPDQLALATFNVENLDPGDGPARFDTLAGLIVQHLQAPDLIALEEVQDNNGPHNDATVDASQTYHTLIAAIQAAGGPAYQFRQIDPQDDQDGGEPGGNIRVGFLFRSDRGLSFVDRPGGTSTAATTVVPGPGGPQLSFSPGRIDPANLAFANSRKPLAGEFRFQGRTLFVIANHFTSKTGDDPLFGRFQPPVRQTEAQRQQQAQVVAQFTASLLAADPAAHVVVLGDLNDFEFSDTLSILKGSGLTNLIERLPPGERYTYVFDGNSQALDHILVSSSLAAAGVQYDIVHVNAEFVVNASDHDPQVARFTFPAIGTPSPQPDGQRDADPERHARRHGDASPERHAQPERRAECHADPHTSPHTCPDRRDRPAPDR